jgi:hypothetical protein
MAGLPKSRGCVLILIVCALAIVAAAQDAPPMGFVDPVGETQTSSDPLQSVIDLIEGSESATPEQKGSLIAAFCAFFDADLLAPDDAAQLAEEMLALVQWESLSDQRTIERVITAMEVVLDGLLAGENLEEALGVLAEVLNEMLTPPGILNALEKAGATADELSLAAELAAGGVPPGILVRVAKDALCQDQAPIDSLDVLSDLVAVGDDVQWGQIANEVTDQGSFKHQDRERNQNENRGAGADPELEEEKNQHGANGSNGKKKGP